MTSRLVRYLKKHGGGLNLADVAYTLQVGRRRFTHRRMLVCSSIADAISALEAGDASRVTTTIKGAKDREVVFMFPAAWGCGAGIGAGLYESEHVFREHIDRCRQLLEPIISLDLRDLDLFPAETATFVTEYALASLWMQWGICPEAMIGHGVGEYVAACLSGVFSLEGALKLLTARAALFRRLPVGATLAVCAPSEALESAQEDFAEVMREIELDQPRIPFISGTTGTWISESEATDPSYWARQLALPVRFAEGLRQLWKDSGSILLEVGPGDTLCSIVRLDRRKPEHCVVLPSLPSGHQTENDSLLNSGSYPLWRAADWPMVLASGRRDG